MSRGETLVAILATGAGLAAIIVDRLSADEAASDLPVAAGLAGAVTIGFAVLLFGWVVPQAKGRRADRAANTALVTSLVGFVSVASAWTGLPFVLGAGGAILGTAARRGTTERRPRGIAEFAVSVGVLAVALACVVIATL